MKLKEIKDKNGNIFPIISKGKSLLIETKLNESLEVKTFIEIVLDDNDTLSLLCNHRSTLSIFDKFNFPFLFSINREAKIKSELPFSIVAKKETAKMEYTIEHISERAKPKLEKFGKRLEARYGKIIEDIQVDVMGLQEERDQQILSMVVSQVIITDFADEEKILKMIKEFEDFVIDDIVPVMLAYVDSSKEEFIDFGIKHREKLISSSKLKEEAYEDVINKLEAKFKVIKPFLSIFWCENEEHEHYSFFIASHSKVPNIICPICDRKLSVGTFYYFMPSINYFLRSGEGLIQALNMYLINKTRLNWASGVYLESVHDDTEKDIIVQTEEQEYSIIEIKSFATDVRLDTKKENIKQLMIQVQKHLISYEKQNISVDTIYVVTNYFVDDEIEKILKDYLSNNKFAELKKIKLEIIGPNNIQNFKLLKLENDDYTI